MAPCKLRAVGRDFTAGQPGARSRVMQTCVVQDAQSRPSEQVRPDEFVQPRVADLINSEVVGTAIRAPDEVVRTKYADVPGRGRVNIRPA